MPTDWTQAVCAQTAPDLFFPEKGSETRQARKLCESCPIKFACLAEALRTPPWEDDFGVRGGLTVRQRRAMRKAAA